MRGIRQWRFNLREAGLSQAPGTGNLLLYKGLEFRVYLNFLPPHPNPLPMGEGMAITFWHTFVQPHLFWHALHCTIRVERDDINNRLSNEKFSPSFNHTLTQLRYGLFRGFCGFYK